MKLGNSVLVTLPLVGVGLAVWILGPVAGDAPPSVALDLGNEARVERSRDLPGVLAATEVAGRVAGGVPSSSPGRAFLKDYWGDEWEEVHAQFLANGGEEAFLDRIDPRWLEDWETVRDQVVERALDPICLDDLAVLTRTLSWTVESGVSDPYGPEFSVNGRPVPQDAIEQIREALRPHDENLALLAGEFCPALREALRHAIYSGEGIVRTPFFGSSPPPVEKTILFIRVSAGGWSVGISLWASRYPGFASLGAAIVDAKQQRLTALLAVLKELGWK